MAGIIIFALIGLSALAILVGLFFDRRGEKGTRSKAAVESQRKRRKKTHDDSVPVEDRHEGSETSEEDLKKKVYAVLMTMASEKALNCASEDKRVANAAETHGRSVNLAQAFIKSMEGNFARMLDQSYAEIGAKYGLSKAVLEDIYNEGQKKNWKQR